MTDRRPISLSYLRDATLALNCKRFSVKSGGPVQKLSANRWMLPFPTS